MNREEFLPISERFREEREKFGFSQDALSKKVHTSRKTVVNWESNLTAPDARQLLELYKLGFDINYIVTGEKLSYKLSKKEANLLSLFSQSNESIKNAAISVLMTDLKPKDIFELEFNEVCDVVTYRKSTLESASTVQQPNQEYFDKSKKKPSM